jgi:hypothetical protein
MWDRVRPREFVHGPRRATKTIGHVFDEEVRADAAVCYPSAAASVSRPVSRRLGVGHLSPLISVGLGGASLGRSVCGGLVLSAIAGRGESAVTSEREESRRRRLDGRRATRKIRTKPAARGLTRLSRFSPALPR